ncbi:hypothetical protein JCM18899A_48390 [Nocardioides sp. AN3]
MEVITWLDDHFRHALHLSVHRRISAPIVVDTFAIAAAQHGHRPPQASPRTDRGTDTNDRVHTDNISKTGNVTLPHNSRLHHIGIGRTYAGTYVRVLVQDLDIRIVDAATGEIPPSEHLRTPSGRS